jgi:hypothetical protein
VSLRQRVAILVGAVTIIIVVTILWLLDRLL